MSQVMPQPAMPYVMVPMRERNGLGVFGFFVALFGLFIPTGIVSLLGLMLCLIAVGRSPRGFAAFGIVLGFLGAAFWITLTVVALVAAAVGLVVAAAGAAVAFAITQPEVLEVTSDMVNVAVAVEEYHEENQQPPSHIASLGLGVSTMTDPWGGEYRLVFADDEMDIISAGQDRNFDTDDDIQLTKLDRYWEHAFATFEDKMEDFGERFEKLNHRHAGVWQGDECGLDFRWDRAGWYESLARSAVLEDDAGATTVATEWNEDDSSD